MKLGFVYAGKIIGNLAPGGVDPYTNEPSAHELGCDLGQGGAIGAGVICPLTIQTDDWHNWGDPTTIDGDVFGLRVLVQVGHTPGASSAILRLEPNTGGGANQATQVTIDSAISIPVGGTPIGNLGSLINVNPSSGIDAWSAAGTLTEGVGGWFKVMLATHERYIQLYDTLV